MAIIDLPIADQRAAVVAEALSWQGTRYMHRGMCKVVRNAADTIVDPGGVDCATLLIAIFQAVGLVAPMLVPEYPPDWHMHRSAERYIGSLLGYAREITEADVLPGDIVVFRYGRAFSHGAIVIDPGWPAIVHAFSASGFVHRDSGDGGEWGNRPRRFFSRWGGT